MKPFRYSRVDVVGCRDGASSAEPALKFVVIVPMQKTFNLYNGSHTRLAAWSDLGVPIKVVCVADVNAGTIRKLDASTRYCVDLCGCSILAIAQLWRNTRHLRPVAFLQDSGVRYWASAFAFRAGRQRKIDLRCLVNLARCTARELAAGILFRRIGYISQADCRYSVIRASVVSTTRAMTMTTRADEGDLRRTLSKVCIFGNFDYPPNRDGVFSLFRSTFFVGTLINNGITVTLNGIGSEAVARQLHQLAPNVVDCVNSGPFATHEDLLQDKDAVICPAMYGAGVKNKIIEATGHRVPCFFWQGFRSEYSYDARLAIPFRDPVDLAKKLAMVSRIAASSFGQRRELWKGQVELLEFFE